MTDSYTAIKRAFRELVMEGPYQSVTVSDICARAHLSRKTFYANFRDKEDIMSRIFIEDAVQPLRDINAIFSQSQGREMYQTIYQKIYEKAYGDKDFYRALVRPLKGRDDAFLRVATQAIYDFNIDLLSGSPENDPQKMDYIAYFFASSQAMLMQKWIYDGFPFTPQELACLYDEMTRAFWISNYGGAVSPKG